MVPRVDRPATLPRLLRARHLLVAAGLVVGIIFALIGTALVVTSRHRTINDAERELKNLSLVLSEEVDRGFQTAELVQTSLIRGMQAQGIDSPKQFIDSMSTQAAHQDLLHRIEGLPQIDALVLIDWRGKLVNISRSWPVPDIDVTDRDFYQALTRDPSVTSFISAPTLNRASGAWTILFARAFRGTGGQLLGFVSIGMEVASIEQFFSRISVSSEASVNLFRHDGVLLARYPHVDLKLGTDFGPSRDFASTRAAVDRGVVRHVGIVDQRERLVAPHSIAHFPLIIAVTNTTSAVLADWRIETLWLAGASGLTELVLAGIVFLGVRQLRAQERLNSVYAAALEAEAGRTEAESELAMAHEREQRQQEAHRQSVRFDTAINNMLQGLLMFDGTGRVLVANRRLNELCGLAEGTLRSGMTYAELCEEIETRGNITRGDIAALRTWRTETAGRGSKTVFTWELVDGRAFTVTNQPMEDGWLATYEDVTDRRAADAKIAHMAHHDALTDLPNRVLFRERLDRALAYARRGQMLAVLCLDLDQFKAVNDTLGHPIGDALLKEVAQRLLERVRETDTVARLGGDEFAVIQTAIDKPTDAVAFATRLITMLEAPFDVAGHRIVIGTSIGIAFAPQDGLDADVILKNADLALYRAKVDGRGVCRLFQVAMDAEMQARRILELDLRQALPCGQLELHYQPLVDLGARTVGGFEALLRWHHPVKGLIAPDKFIPLAEEIGAIIPIGEWVMRQACATATTWPDGLKVSVNLSPIQFKSRNLVQMVADALAESGLEPDRLELEITETVMLQDTETTLATLHDLHALGVRIAMDDFGTGYSSLSYLRRFPFDRIKIDQSFVRQMGKEEDCGAIIRAVIGLSRELGISTTAEGVETREQLNALAVAGCSVIQGFLFSRPVEASAISELLRTMPKVDDLMRESLDQPPPLAVAEAYNAAA